MRVTTRSGVLLATWLESSGRAAQPAIGHHAGSSIAGAAAQVGWAWLVPRKGGSGPGPSGARRAWPWRQRLRVSAEQRSQRPERKDRQRNQNLNHGVAFKRRLRSGQEGVLELSRRALPVPAIEFRISVSA